MYCPKCGLQNTDDTKFCRGCGAQLTNVLASLEGKVKGSKFSLAERSVILYSRGIRGVLTGVAMLVVAALMLLFRQDVKMYWLIPVTVSLVVFAASIARFVQASGYKKLDERGRPGELSRGSQEFLSPPRSIYDTDDLLHSPFSVTERTTNLLRPSEDKQ